MESMNKMLLEYSLENVDFCEDVKCLICHRYLVDPCQTMCGCLYCWECIKYYLENGKKYCPGKKESCKITKMDLYQNISRDSSILERVCNVKVKCPLINCNYESKLINMWDHLRICQERNNYCPYKEMGCNTVMSSSSEIINHLNTEVSNHTHILIDWATNMKNDTKAMVYDEKSKLDLKIKNLEMKLEKDIIQYLNEQNEKKQKVIVQLGTEISMLKEENKIILKEEKRQRESIFNKMKAMNDNIICLTERINQRDAEIDEMKKNLNSLISGFPENHSSISTTSSKTSSLENFPLMELDISQVALKRTMKDYILSEYFDFKKNGYKMRLSLHFDTSPSFLDIMLRVHPINSKSRPKWPFQSKVEIVVFNKVNPKAKLAVTQDCRVICNDRSAPFHFEYEKLSTLGILLNDAILVKCFIFF